MTIEIRQRRNYTGPVADKASITPGNGDTFFATDTEQLFIGQGGIWTHFPRYVPLDPSSWDFDVGDFTTDGTWKVNGLDLSGILPAGCIAVKLRISLNDDAVNSYFAMARDKDAALIPIGLPTQVANVSVEAWQDYQIDSDLKLDYVGSNVVFVTINIAVVGYWI